MTVNRLFVSWTSVLSLKLILTARTVNVNLSDTIYPCPIFWGHLNLLFPINIKNLLEKKSKSHSIDLIPLPKGDDGVNRIIYFLEQSQKQNATIRNKIDVNKLMKEGHGSFIVTSPVVPRQPSDFISTLFATDVCIFAKSDDDVLFPVDPKSLSAWVTVPSPVSVEGKMFYQTVVRSQDHKSIFFKIGDSVSIDFKSSQKAKKKKVTMNFTPSSNLARSSNDFRFFLAICEAGKFEIGSNTLLIIDKKKKVPVEAYRKVLMRREQIAAAFETLRLNLDVDLAKFSDSDWKNVDVLIRTIVEKKTIPIENSDFPMAGLTRMTIGYQQIILCYLKVQEPNVYRLSDFSNCDVELFCDLPNGEKCSISLYSLLDQDDLVNVSNIDFAAALPSFRKITDNHQHLTDEHQRLTDKQTFGDANNLFLRMLNAFDECKKIGKKEHADQLLKTAVEFDEWLLQKKEMGNYFEELNHLQVVKRRCGTFTDDEAKLLLQISNNMNIDVLCRFAACVLLGEDIRAKSIWSELDPIIQEDFRKWPIARFFNQTDVSSDKNTAK